MEEQKQEDEEDQEELQAMVPISNPEQKREACIDSMNENLVDLRVNKMPSHIEDQPQSSSLEPLTTVFRGIETTSASSGFELLISIQTSSSPDVSSFKRSRIESVITKTVTNNRL